MTRLGALRRFQGTVARLTAAPPGDDHRRQWAELVGAASDLCGAIGEADGQSRLKALAGNLVLVHRGETPPGLRPESKRWDKPKDLARFSIKNTLRAMGVAMHEEFELTKKRAFHLVACWWNQVAKPSKPVTWDAVRKWPHDESAVREIRETIARENMDLESIKSAAVTSMLDNPDALFPRGK